MTPQLPNLMSGPVTLVEAMACYASSVDIGRLSPAQGLTSFQWACIDPPGRPVCRPGTRTIFWVNLTVGSVAIVLMLWN